MDGNKVSRPRIDIQPNARVSRRGIITGATLAAATVAVFASRSPLTAWADDNGGNQDQNDQGSATILRFSTMAGIQKPFLGDAGLAAFRGVHGGGAAWVLSGANGALESNGHLRINVRGLVLDPASVPPPNGGTNPVPFFMAIVSGFSTDPVNPVNLSTSLFPASSSGDSMIETTLSLPHPFFAPIIFVTSLPIGTPAAPRWFAVTGLQ